MKGRSSFFAVQQRRKDSASTTPWVFIGTDTYRTAEAAFDVRNTLAGLPQNGNVEFRAVEVHVTTELEVIG